MLRSIRLLRMDQLVTAMVRARQVELEQGRTPAHEAADAALAALAAEVQRGAGEARLFDLTTRALRAFERAGGAS